MVAEQCCSLIFAERAEDLQKVGKQPVESWAEGQNAAVPQMVDQWLEVPKILPQDRVLQTAKQIADHLDKRGTWQELRRWIFSGEGKLQLEALWNDRRAVGRVITAEEKLHDEKQLKSIIEECAEKVVGELQKRTVTETGENQKSIVEECAAKVVGELQKKMAAETGKNQIEWAVRGGGQLMASLGTWDQDRGTRMGFKTTGDIEGSPRSPRARQVWLKMDGKVKAVELRDETEKEMEEKVREVDEGEGRNGLVCHL